MQFTRLKLKNFRCFGNIDTKFANGVTVIHGINGAGKSSLLESCFFALYGSNALDTTETLESVITKGENNTTVELWFTHQNSQFRLEREIRWSNTTERATTATCTLEKDGTTIANGATNVENTVAELLRMDASSFLNCAYVRQGAITTLLDASPSERQDMIDELLQLGKLETYRERASKTRIGIKRTREIRQERLQNLSEKIDEKDRDSLEAKLQAVTTELTEIKSDIESFQSQRTTFENEYTAAKNTVETVTQKQNELESLQEQIGELNQKINDRTTKKETLEDTIQDNEARIADLQEELEILAEKTPLDTITESTVTNRQNELKDRIETTTDQLTELSVTINELNGQITTHNDKAEEFETRANAKETKATELRAEADEKEADVTDTRERLETKEQTITEAKESFTDAPVEFGEATTHLERTETDLTDAKNKKRECEQQVHTLTESIQEAEALLEKGKCPECAQDVEHSPHVETLDADKQKLEEAKQELQAAETEVETTKERVEHAKTLAEAEQTAKQASSDKDAIESLLEERETTITSLRETADEHLTTAEELRQKATDRREQASTLTDTLDAKTDKENTLETRKTALTDEQETLNTIEETLTTIKNTQTTIKNAEQRIEDIDEIINTFRTQLKNKAEHAEELRSDVDETRLNEARAKMNTAATNKKRFEKRIEQSQAHRAQLDETRGGLKNELQSLTTLENEYETVNNAVTRLTQAYDEAEELESMYQNLRHELRKKNVQHLQRLLNEIFELIYETDTYAKIELSDTYEFTVYEKGGETLKPTELSGGEKALFNLSLRTAIFQLLIEGIDSGAPMPPLILDEPTVHLDDNHVDRISDLVQRMRDLGVEQTLVISHNNEIVDAADERIEVQKNSSTNRSSVHTESNDILAGIN